MGGAIHPTVPEEWIRRIEGYRNEVYKYKPPLKDKYHEKCKIECGYSLNWVKHYPSHSKWVSNIPSEDAPTYGDIGRSHVNRHDWGNQTEKRDNTLQFVKRICDEFSIEAGVICRTKRPDTC